MKGFMVAIFSLGLLASFSAHAGSVEDKYNKACAACHSTGAAGAPKKGDKAAWAPRLKQGEAVLLNHIRNGFKAMPARGLCADCTDADYKALIKYMSK
jgi:cytochrome c5